MNRRMEGHPPSNGERKRGGSAAWQMLVALLPAIAAVLIPSALAAMAGVLHSPTSSRVVAAEFVMGAPARVSCLQVVAGISAGMDGAHAALADRGVLLTCASPASGPLVMDASAAPLTQAAYDAFVAELQAGCRRLGVRCTQSRVDIDTGADLLALAFWGGIVALALAVGLRYRRLQAPNAPPLALRARLAATVGASALAYVGVIAVALAWQSGVPGEASVLKPRAMGLVLLVPLLVSALVEEMVYRAWPLALARRHDLPVAPVALAASILFAAAHFDPGQPHVAAGNVLVGLILSALYLRTRSWIDCVIAHALFNLAIAMGHQLAV